MATTWSYEDLRANGVSLKNYGYGISVVGGLSGIPAKEGDNYNVAYGRGYRYRSKQYQEVQRQFAMWIDSRDPDTGLYSSDFKTRVARRNANAAELFRLFTSNEAPVTLTRDVIVPSGSTWTTETWQAECEVREAVYPDWGDKSAEETIFTFSMVFMDPFWYGATTSASVNSGSTVVVNNTGDVPAIDMTIRIIGGSGGLVNPQLTNNTNTVYYRHGVTIANADYITTETKYPRVVRASDAANVMGTVVNSGSRSFMRLERGVNTLALSADSGAGSAEITFRPPHV